MLLSCRLLVQLYANLMNHVSSMQLKNCRCDVEQNPTHPVRPFNPSITKIIKLYIYIYVSLTSYGFVDNGSPPTYIVMVGYSDDATNSLKPVNDVIGPYPKVTASINSVVLPPFLSSPCPTYEFFVLTGLKLHKDDGLFATDPRSCTNSLNRMMSKIKSSCYYLSSTSSSTVKNGPHQQLRGRAFGLKAGELGVIILIGSYTSF